MCNDIAANCMVSQKHDYREVFESINSKIELRNREIVIKITELATKAMMYELCCTSKLGFVDRYNNGAYSDMNYYIFVDSSIVLIKHFKTVAQKYVDWLGNPDELFDNLRQFGKEAENDVFKTNNGVYIHRDQIFLMGLACSAAANILHKRGKAKSEWILDIIRKMTKNSSYNELKEGYKEIHCEKLYRHYGLVFTNEGLQVIKELDRTQI